MKYTVTVAARANPRVKALRGKAKDKFWEAVNRLEHEGCAAGHYRMRAPDGGDAHICANVGRPRKDQPPCCDEFDKAPIDQKLVDRINALRPSRHS